jgi:hypothetical protein
MCKFRFQVHGRAKYFACFAGTCTVPSYMIATSCGASGNIAENGKHVPGHISTSSLAEMHVRGSSWLVQPHDSRYRALAVAWPLVWV